MAVVETAARGDHVCDRHPDAVHPPRPTVHHVWEQQQPQEHVGVLSLVQQKSNGMRGARHARWTAHWKRWVHHGHAASDRAHASRRSPHTARRRSRRPEMPVLANLQWYLFGGDLEFYSCTYFELLEATVQ